MPAHPSRDSPASCRAGSSARTSSWCHRLREITDAWPTAGEQAEVECLVGLLLAVDLHFNRDRLRRLAGGEGQRAGFGDGVFAGLGGAVAEQD